MRDPASRLDQRQEASSMRRAELICGMLAGLLGVAALALALTQHPTHMFSGTVSYAPLVPGPNPRDVTTLSTLLAAGVAVVACLLVALAAVRDTRSRATRGAWRWGAPLAALASVGGVYLLILSTIWVGFGGPGPFYRIEISASLLFAPAMLAAILCALASFWPRRAMAAPPVA